MRRMLSLVVLAACSKSGGGGSAASVELATPDAAKAVATKLAAALTACDRAALDATLDLKYLALRATDDAKFTDLVLKEGVACDELAVEVVDRPAPQNVKPLLRWRHGNAVDCDLRTFGYTEVTVDKAGKIADLETPLHPQSAVTSLRNIHANLPSRDWPGMISDILGGPFSGLYTGATFATQLENPAHASTARPENLDNVIEYGFRGHDYSAVLVAVNKLAAVVGEDPLLASLRVAAAIGAKQGAYAVQLAQDATTKWPNDLDVACVRVHAEMAGGTTATIEGAKQQLSKCKKRLAKPPSLEDGDSPPEPAR